MTNLGKVAQKFLNELHSSEVVETFETLVFLNESMETIIDPDPIEICLVESIYHFLEKLKVLENNIQSYVRDVKRIPNSKLDDLYDRESTGTTSVMFK